MRHNLKTLGFRWGFGKPRSFRDGVVDANRALSHKEKALSQNRESASVAILALY